MATQKELLADLRSFAADLGAIVTIRKNAHGEYEARVRMNGSAAYVLEYFASDWLDAEETVLFTLNRIKDEQRAEGERRKAQHYADLDVAFGVINTMLSLVHCTVEMSRYTDGRVTVTMRSPKTGTHTLDMTFGNRPVTDLYAHACGFAEQQTHVRS